MAKSENDNSKQVWNPDKYFKAFENLVDDYERDHPYWQTEVFISLLQRGMLGLRRHLEKVGDTVGAWDSPFLDMDYPVDWNWDAPSVTESNQAYSGLILGKLTKENTCDTATASRTLGEMLVRRLNTLALANFTNDVWFEIKNDYRTPILPLYLKDQLEAVKDSGARRELFEELVRPFSIGAATIDLSSMEMENGETVSKEVADQLRNIKSRIDIDRIGIDGEINGSEFKTSLIFQIHPLVADYDQKKAYYTITAGLFFEPEQIEGEFVAKTPADWSPTERNLFWAELDTELGKLTDRLIPKAESESSQIFQINAQLEIPLSPHGDTNEALKEILENLSKTGQVRKITVEPADMSSDTAKGPSATNQKPDAEKTPKNPIEGATVMIWNSRFRPVIIVIAVLIASLAIFTALPEQIKMHFLNLLGIH